LAQLGEGDVAGAEKSLIDSAKVPGERDMRLDGPNFQLATGLRDAGRNNTVDQFLELLETTNWAQSEKAAGWRKDLAAGKRPDFGRLFSYN